MLGIFLQDGHEYREVRPRASVTCRVCGKQREVEAEDCALLLAEWKAHPWWRETMAGHVCGSCFDGAVEANAEVDAPNGARSAE